MAPASTTRCPHHQGDFPVAEKAAEEMISLPLYAEIALSSKHAYRHTRFAPLWVPERIRDEGLQAARTGRTLGPLVPNLSARGRLLAETMGGPAHVMRAIVAHVNCRRGPRPQCHAENVNHSDSSCQRLAPVEPALWRYYQAECEGHRESE